jgi:antitoxin VapB
MPPIGVFYHGRSKSTYIELEVFHLGLNIKNKEAHELAAELAKLTGRSMTAVVLDALRIQLKQLQRSQDKEARLQELMAIGKRCAAHIHHPVTALQHGEMLYDETGMPG